MLPVFKTATPPHFMQLVPGPLSSGAEQCLLRTVSPFFLGPSANPSPCGDAFRDSHPPSDFPDEVFGSRVSDDGGGWGVEMGVRARQMSPTLS